MGFCKITIRHPDVKKFPYGETVWAAKVDINLYKLRNIPIFSSRYSLGDLVDTDENLVVVGRPVERCARTYHVEYDPAGIEAEVKERLGRIRSFLNKLDIQSEPGIKGVLSLAVPLNIKKKKLTLILASCDETVSLITLQTVRNRVEKVFL